MDLYEDKIIDSQIACENVQFLDCFDNSCILQDSIHVIKDYVAQETSQIKLSNRKAYTAYSVIPTNSQQRKSINSTLNSPISNKTIEVLSGKKLSSWGLPPEISKKYGERGIHEMFDWQVKCLSNSKVLLDSCNLVYSAPTSAGKTLVAEILTIKTVLERQKKVMIILPFVSIVREKMFYLQDILSSSGIRVEGFVGSQSPPGGLHTVHVAICTIEKANSLINKHLDDGSISELGTVVVDEMHLLGDPHRGYILELLLTKIKYVSSKPDHGHIQIVGMSATLPNLDLLAKWLEAELFITQFRPIPLEEYCLVGKRMYNQKLNLVNPIENNEQALLEYDEVFNICFSTLKDGCSVLIFCMTKNRCESLAQSIAMSFYKLGCSGKPAGNVIREQLNSDSIMEVLQQLESCPVGLDGVLKKTISFGVAFHHAGLTFDERDIIEGGFKSSALRVLVATSTLSSGVNLPARKVIVRSPVFQRQPINILTYKQMIGRAGRMGRDTKGESILICSEAEKQIGFNLMTSPLQPVKSCIDSEDKFMRAILEMVASEEACTMSELELYSECTLLFKQEQTVTQKKLLEKTLKELVNYELIKMQKNDVESKYYATSLGKACLSSSMAPNDGLSLFIELQRARQCLVLENDLHLIYLVTPYSVSSQWGDIDWLHLLTMWESLTKSMKKVGELVGIEESFIVRCVRGTNKSSYSQNKMGIHKRFYTALALQDLVNEVPLAEVASKFQCARGFLQSLQQSAATFAGMVTVFCHQLGWKSMELLVSQFQDRLHFGIHSELVELMRLPSLNGLRARSIFNAGFETIVSITSADPEAIESALIKAVPFESEKQREGDDNCDIRKRNKLKNIWITGSCGLTSREAAENLINEARKYLQLEIGVSNINWEKKNTKPKENLVSIDSPKSINIVTDDNNILGNRESITILTKDVDILNNSDNDLEIKHQENTLTVDIVDIECGMDSESIEKTSETTIRPANHTLLSTGKENSNSGSNEVKNETIWDSLNLSDINVETQQNIIPYKSLKSTKEATFVKPHDKVNINIKKVSTEVSNFTEAFQWESMNFSEIPIATIAKIKSPEDVFSPEISFSDNNQLDELHNDKTSPQSSSGIKDLSLFSSEGECSSLFEDSLQLDGISSHLIDLTESPAQESNPVTETFNSAFQSEIILDEDEDIKLVYEDGNSDRNSDNIFSSENESDPRTERAENKSLPLKRHFANNKNVIEPLAKVMKLEIIKSTKPKDSYTDFMKAANKNKVKVNNESLVYYIVKETDVLEFLDVPIHCKMKSVAVHLLVNNLQPPMLKEIIGANIINKDDDNSKKPDCCKLKGIALHFENFTFFLDISTVNKDSLFRSKLNTWLIENAPKFKVSSSKYTNVCLKEEFNIELPKIYDVAIAYWLVHNDEDAEVNLNTMLQKMCNTTMPKIMAKNSIKDACVKAWAVWNIAQKQESQNQKQYEEFKQVLDTELKISKLLATSEYKGIRVDKDLAAQLLCDVNQTVDILQRKVYQICGQRFNMNSSKSVAKMLGIYKGKKVSTKKSILTAHDSLLATCVIYWRKLNAIRTKTLYPLTEKAVVYGENNRIRSTYNTFTSTGRVTMHEPNLQNVPRTFSIPTSFLTEGPNVTTSGDVIEFNCRNIFRAESNWVFVSADYCQLEMRILTHFCEDSVLMKIMKSDMDVFRSIAASWGGVAEEQVDDDLRQKAKQLCYGIIYGMGNKTLSTTLDVSEMEAAVFMDTFHKTYPAIRQFITSLIDRCQDNCYIETLMKRRRHIPDLKLRTNASIRQAVNSTIQGSAADIVKSAMCEIEHRYTHTYKQADWPILVLQMHDELVYEVPEFLMNDFVKIMKEVMENNIALKVPLPVKMKSGYTWGSLTELRV